MTGALKGIAKNLSSPTSLRVMGARRSAVSLAKAHQSTLRDFFSNVLLRAQKVKPPPFGDPTKTVTLSFPNGKFDGHRVRAGETLRPPKAETFGSPRSTVMAIAFSGHPFSLIRSVAAGETGPQGALAKSVIIPHVPKCPDHFGHLIMSVDGVTLVEMNLGGHLTTVPITLKGSALGIVDDHGLLNESFNLSAHVEFQKASRRIDAQERVGFPDANSIELTHVVQRADGEVVSVSDSDFLVAQVTADQLIAEANQALARAMSQSQKFWQQGGCLSADFTPAAPVAKPNEQLFVGVNVHRRDDQAPVKNARLEATVVSGGGTVAPDRATTDTSGNATFTFTAPADVQTQTLRVSGTSNQGTVKGTLVICMESAAEAPLRAAAADQCVPPQPFFRVISYTSSTTASGSDDGNFVCQFFGDTMRGTIDTDETLPSAQASAPASNTLTESSGFFDGEIQADGINLTFSNYSTHNCFLGPNDTERPCDNTLPDKTVTAHDGVSLIGPSGSNVQVLWPLNGPSFGAIDDACAVLFNADMSFEEIQTTEPLATFQTPGEHTITFSGSKHFDRDSLGNSASIDFSWNFSLTFEVVPSPG